MELTGNQLRFAKVRPGARIPTKSEENAGYDIYADFDDDYVVINPHETRLIPTGIASALSNDYYLQVQERGSTGSKGIKYGAGVIDPGYRGEIFIAITNVNPVPLFIAKTDAIEKLDEFLAQVKHPGMPMIVYPYEKAIAQLIVHRIHKMDVAEVTYDELKAITSQRGEGALGSSGK